MDASLERLPIVYEIDASTQILYAAVGPWTADAIREWLLDLLEDPEYLPGMRALINLRFAAGPLPGISSSMRIADSLAPVTTIPIRTRWALLVGSQGMHDRVRLLETMTSAGNIQFRAFDDEDNALQWLGLEDRRNPWMYSR